METSKNRKNIVLVLGMHRSGTSAIAALVNNEGFYIGEKILQADESNPRGYFENIDIVNLNDEILNYFNQRWYSLDNIEINRYLTFLSAYYDEFAERAKALIQDLFKGTNQVLIKDPRICITFPFWARVFRELKIDTTCLYVYRNPIEVAQSINKRDDLSFAGALRLWTYYNYALLNNLDLPYLFVSYAELIKDPAMEAARVKEYIGSKRDVDVYEAIDVSLRNNIHRGKLFKSVSEHEVPPTVTAFMEELESRAFLERDISEYSRPILDYLGVLLHKGKYDYYQIFYSKSGQFTEEDSTRHFFQRTSLNIKETIKEEGVHKVRLDPSIYQCVVIVDDVSIHTDQGVYRPRNIEANTQFSYSGNLYIFDHGDANIVFEFDEHLHGGLLEINLRIFELGGATSAFVNKQLRHERDELLRERALLRWRQNANQKKGKLADWINACYVIFKSRKFDIDWYLLTYPDVGEWSQDRSNILVRLKQDRNRLVSFFPKILTHPIYHFVKSGVYEGRNPNPNFSTIDYLVDHEDVQESGINPFYHYVAFGEQEGRKVAKARNRIGGDYSSKHQNLQVMDGKARYSRFQSVTLNPSITDLYKPLVTVIVPNYNHEAYLRERLDSIFQQTYSNYEVLLMDDCSTDGSREILTQYHERYPNKTKCIFNETNSGSVFRQWKKGLEIAKGELIWIAESDDFCDPNFLEELVNPCRDDAVLLSYARTTFVNSTNTDKIWEIESYLGELDQRLWQEPFIRTSERIVKSFFSIKNIIPNVSSCIFRNPGEFPLFRNETWLDMRLCGDWLFYILLIRGGLIAYTPDTTNYYRIHDNNMSVSHYQNDVYYQEHQEVARNIVQHYDVDFLNFKRQAEILKGHWRRTRGKFDEEQFQKCYDLDAIKAAYGNRKPNILLCAYAFSSGGGETFPINLANLMSDYGYTVTLLSFDRAERNQGVKGMLYPRIPIVNNFYSLNTILAELNIDIVHSHHAWVDMTIASLKSRRNVKHVVSLHGMYEMIEPKHAKMALEKIVKKVDCFVWTAEKNKSAFIENGYFELRKFSNIGNAVIEKKINPVDLADLGIGEDAFVICMVSRAIPEKGWEEAIKSVEHARKLTDVDIHLLLIGDGPEVDRLSKNKAKDFIHFLGFKDNIRDYYAASHLGLLSSRFRGESYPLVLIDCLSSGTPVIATNIGEVEKMLYGEEELAGSLIDLEDWRLDYRKLGALIAEYVQDRGLLEKKKQIVPQAAQKFKAEHVVKAYDELYTQLVKH